MFNLAEVIDLWLKQGHAVILTHAENGHVMVKVDPKDVKHLTEVNHGVER